MATLSLQSILPGLTTVTVPACLQRTLGRALGITQVAQLYESMHSVSGRSLASSLLERLGVTYRIVESDLANVPRKGACVLVTNHPFGVLDGAVLATVLGDVRRDVRILANGILHAVPELREIVIAVDPDGGPAAATGNSRGLRMALDHLLDGGLLVVFPAGEVAHFDWRIRRVAESAWRDVAVRLVAMADRRGVKATVVPCHVAGTNSLLFQVAGLLHPRLRTALLARELLNKRGRQVHVRIGASIPAAKLLAAGTPEEQTAYLRWRSELLAARSFKPQTSRPLSRAATERTAQAVPVEDAIPADFLAAEVAELPPKRLMVRSGDLAVYLAPAYDIPNVLHEIGRLREITFRAAGEGTGKALDLDVFDATYLHLFVWNEARREVVGAYRIGRTDLLLQRQGIEGIYTATLFEYGEGFFERIGPALELGRSFVRQEYQRAFGPLLLLWKGIGRFVAMEPEYKVLFGPVSISNTYQARSRDLMVSFLEKYAWLEGLSSMVRQRNGFIARPGALPPSEIDLEDVSDAVADLEPDRAGMPVLLRQYLKLGGKLLAFNVDPDFAHALDGLILVDLTRTEPKLLERYLGKQEVMAFKKFHWCWEKAA